MSRPLSPVTASAIAAVLAMTTFALTAGCLRGGQAGRCLGPACETKADSTPQTRRSLGLIDL